MQNRRGFIKSSSIASLGLISLSQNLYSINRFSSRKMKISLMPGTIGINVNANELLDLAIKNNFESIYPLINDIKQMSTIELSDYLDKMASKSISFDVSILPVDFSQTNSIFNDGIKVLKDYCKVMKKIESIGFCRWIMPTSNNLTYLKNFKTHKERLKECAKIIGDNDMKLGLEFVGPKTLMARDQFSFIRTINELRELLEQYAQSDFTKSIVNPKGDIASGLNNLSSTINSMLHESKLTGLTLEENSGKLSSNVDILLVA